MEAAARVLRAWDLSRPQLAVLSGGLINTTLLVTTPDARYVLQRLHPIFSGEVNEDIEAVTQHLAARGLVTPRLVRTRDGRLWVDDDGAWRLQTFVEGSSVQRVDSPSRAEAAGALVGRFHAALADLRHDFVFRRAGVHDTARHFALLDESIDLHATDPLHASVARMRDELVAIRTTLPVVDAAALPLRITHGDLKISNLMFDDRGRGVCLVDLDTLGHMPMPFELGDAWRSWCNPLGEDDAHARFELPLLAAAWRGYSSTMQLSNEERALLVPGILTICVELSARFLRDVLDDTYFGWDPTRFATRAAHNQVRARSQLALAQSLRAQEQHARSLF
ncbi:MAG: phosphotransferase [Polyangia bacterium]